MSPWRISAARPSGPLLAVLLAGLGLPAQAGPDGSAVSLFATRPYSLDGAAKYEAAFFEQVSLFTPGTDLGPLGDARVVVRGWGRALAGDAMYGSQNTGDIDVAYIEGRVFDKHLQIRVGRQLLTGGAVRNVQLDGMSFAAKVWRGLGVEIYGGSPVTPRLNFSRGNALAGGRVFYRLGFDAEVGASYVYAQEDGSLTRSDFALDAWWRASQQVTLGGNAQWSLYESRFAEGRLLATWQPNRTWQITADAARTAPDLFLARNSIFSVFSEERRDEGGAEVAYRLGPALSAYLEGHLTSVEAGSGWHTGGKLTWRPEPVRAPGTTLGAEVKLLDEPANGFEELRLFVLHRFPYQISSTLELDGYRLNHAVNGRMSSFIAVATAGMPFATNWDAMVSCSLGTTPYLERRTDFSARVVWHFGGPGGRP